MREIGAGYDDDGSGDLEGGSPDELLVKAWLRCIFR